MMVPDCVFGRGGTLSALRRRGIISGRQPHAELTPLGERVCRALDRKEGLTNGE